MHIIITSKFLCMNDTEVEDKTIYHRDNKYRVAEVIESIINNTARPSEIIIKFNEKEQGINGVTYK